MQLNGNTLIDLFERIKDLLRDGRIDIVYNVANRQDLNAKLKQTFKSLADLITAKNNERQFYKNCINFIMEGGQINKQMFANQYKIISSDMKDNVIMLQNYVNNLKTNEEGNAQLRANLEQLQNRLQQIQTEKQMMENGMQNQIQMLSSQNERFREQLSEQIQILRRQCDKKGLKISQLENQLASKITQIKILSSEYEKSKQLCQRMKQELDRQNLKLSMSVSAQNQKNSKIIKEKDEQIDFLKQKLHNDSLNIKASNIVGHSTILSGNQLILPASLSQIIERQVGKEVVYMQKLYDYSQQKRINFHQNIDRKSNILLVCQTIHDVLLGAFTTSSFSLMSEGSQTNAFIFGTKEQQIRVNRLKKGRESVSYDVDFLIFGNDELCIQKGKNILSSYAPNAVSNQLHYESRKDDNYFTAVLDDKGMVQLKNYEVLQIQFAQ